MSTSHFILLIERDARPTDALATQLVRLGVEPVRVSDLDEGIEIVKSRQYAISAVLVPSDMPGRAIQRALKLMGRHEPVLPCMVYGKEPDRAQRKQLRQAGVLLSLWDGYDAGMLRFQINRLVSGDHASVVRGSRRAPIHAPARVEVGGRVKEGVLYSLSEGGCFIETPRASMDGARLRLQFALGEQEYSVDGVVAFANVPGNLQRPRLPLGMGVRFETVSKALRKELARFIEARLGSLEV